MQQINNGDKVNLVIGGILFSIGALVDLMLSKQANTNFKMKKDIEKWRKQSENWKYYNWLKKQQNKDAKVNVVVQKSSAKFQDDSLKIRIRQMPLHLQKSQYFDHVTGGKFELFHKGQYNLTQINDTRILSSILSEKTKKISFFGYMDPVVKSAQYFLKKGLNIALVGSLSYDFSIKRFKLQPLIMGNSITEIIEHYHDHYILATLPRFFSLLVAVLGVWFMFKPLKKLFNKLYQKFLKKENAEQKQKEYYRNHVQFKVSKQHIFECYNCHTNSTDIAYRCGHLSICQKCHEVSQKNHKSYICPVCKQSSKSFIRIYFA